MLLSINHKSAINWKSFLTIQKNYGKLEIKSGMAWSKDLFRQKSTEDLQKLWYILLKERNKLNTSKLHCVNEDEPMSGPDRLEKIAQSMSNLRDVIEEREQAVNMLTHGTPDKIGGEWTKSQLGHVYFCKYKKHLLPKGLNRDHRADRPADTAMFSPKLEKWHLRKEERGMLRNVKGM